VHEQALEEREDAFLVLDEMSLMFWAAWIWLVMSSSFLRC